MGARWFETTAEGQTPRQAFGEAIREARFLHGHSGYTGTIAEKWEFTEVSIPKGMTLKQFLFHAIDDDRFDKDEPAGCINLGEGKFVFFGWASS